jgi:hypothetical protein
VFSTNDDYYSQADLTKAQDYYNLPSLTATDIGGYETSSCSVTSSGNQCGEGNLDVQYISAVAQRTGTIFWHVGTGSPYNDPFLNWIMEVSADSTPPQTNSISYGSSEGVSFEFEHLCFCFFL